MTTRPHPADYAPYNRFPEFVEGISAYMAGVHENPYRDPRQGLGAQAWDRGAEFAMRVRRFCETGR
jgi:hypothetical protein